MRKILAYSLWTVVCMALGFIVIEGAFSTLFVLHLIHQPDADRLAERQHTRYDPQLGWSNIPNRVIENLYGDGVFLRINKEGFRDNQDVSDSSGDGRTKIVCSGDSFTMGYGVDNDHTWCHLLSVLDPHLRTINMGQGGYGIDQAYLWYLRDGLNLGHQLHVFAVIGDDFDRCGPSFLGYSKPYFVLKNDALELRNVPVPPQSSRRTWLVQIQEAAGHLMAVRGIRRAADSLSGKLNMKPANSIADLRSVLGLKILEDLVLKNNAKGIPTVIVYLPTRNDLEVNNERLKLRGFLSVELGKTGVKFIDLTGDFLKAPYSEVQGMFIDPIQYPGSGGHYSKKGTDFVAHSLLRELSPLLTSFGRSDSGPTGGSNP